MKTKRQNEKEKGRKDKPSHNISSSTNKSIMLARAMLQIAPPRCSSSLSFSLPKVSTYTPSLLKNVRNDFQTPPKGLHLLRQFSSKRFVIPKQSFQTWSVYRGPSFELPKLKEHMSSSHPIPCTILCVSPLTVLSTGVLNSRSNSLEPGGHDASQANKKMTRDANDHYTMRSHPKTKVEQIFNVHEVQDDQKVKLASVEFLEYAMQWWHKIVMDIDLNKRPTVVSWDDLKECMRTIFVPPHYRKELLLKLQRLHQGTQSVDAYFKELETTLTKVDMHEMRNLKWLYL